VVLVGSSSGARSSGIVERWLAVSGGGNRPILIREYRRYREE